MPARAVYLMLRRNECTQRLKQRHVGQKCVHLCALRVLRKFASVLMTMVPYSFCRDTPPSILSNVILLALNAFRMDWNCTL